jgi:uncharacterized protein (DUF58 family)
MESKRIRRADLLDPATIAALGRIEIIARWIVDGFMTGLHRSPRRGFSVEFAEHRPYQTGDDLRYVDWKIVARADRWVVKQFEEETNLRATIVLDVSRSMAWTGSVARVTKLAYAETLCAALSLLLIRQRDAVGLIRFDDAVRTLLPPRARLAHWRRLVGALDESGMGKGSRAGSALNDAARMVRRPGMVILVSDLLMDTAEVIHAARSLRAIGHDVVVFHIMDPDEHRLTISGDALLVDPESDLEVPATVADVRDAYEMTVDQAISEWRASLASAGARYELVLTDTPFGVPLGRAFAARQRLP